MLGMGGGDSSAIEVSAKLPPVLRSAKAVKNRIYYIPLNTVHTPDPEATTMSRP